MFRFAKASGAIPRAPLSRRNPTRARGGTMGEGGRVTKLPRGVQGVGVARGVWIGAR